MLCSCEEHQGMRAAENIFALYSRILKTAILHCHMRRQCTCHRYRYMGYTGTGPTLITSSKIISQALATSWANNYSTFPSAPVADPLHEPRSWPHHLLGLQGQDLQAAAAQCSPHHCLPHAPACPRQCVRHTSRVRHELWGELSAKLGGVTFQRRSCHLDNWDNWTCCIECCC